MRRTNGCSTDSVGTRFECRSGSTLAVFTTITHGSISSLQICLSPEYVLVPEHFQDKFVEALQEVYKSFYPDGPRNSDSYCRIVSEAHTKRIKNLIDQTKGTIVFGGDADIAERYIAPTVVRDVRLDDPLMGE